MSALFLRHEGFLGAVGAFLKVHPMHVPTASSVAAGHARAAAANAADGSSSVARQDSRVLHESASTKVRVVGLCVHWKVQDYLLGMLILRRDSI
jgi:type II pantothenate kinase